MTGQSPSPTHGTEEFVALLGTKGGPAVRPGSTMPTSSLVSLGGQQIVVDCGLGFCAIPVIGYSQTGSNRVV